VETLKDFHRRRVQILADSGADLLAFETVPNKLEAEVSYSFGQPNAKIYSHGSFLSLSVIHLLKIIEA